jgi:AbiV family abortive infection protein
MNLTRTDLFEAIHKSLANARDLIEEAEILAQNKKIARAYTLFQLSIEEVGKASLTFNFVLKGNIENATEIKEFDRSFCSHTSKTKLSQGIDFMFALMSEKTPTTKKLLENFIEQMDKVDISNDNKNYSLYTSLIDNKFYKPSEIITEEQLSNIAFYAKLRLSIATPFFTLGIENFDVLYENRNILDEEETLNEAAKKMREILEKI